MGSVCDLFDVEGDFDKLTEAAEGFSARRNDVAHGTVFLVTEIEFFSSKFEPRHRTIPGWALIPPYYATRSYEDGMPTWAYTSAELDQLSLNLARLRAALTQYRALLERRGISGLPGALL